MASFESQIWDACGGKANLTPVAGRLLRLVESQEQVATNRLVASLQAQAILEDLLETSKPVRSATTQRLHYLLATPFRYPPLRHGSRFGRYHEPSLFYGSLSIATVLAETAYYRFVFLYGMAELPEKSLTTQHTLFAVRYASQQGIKLHQTPFNAWQADLTSRHDYTATQSLGSAMRADQVMAFEFTSARDPQAGLNVALYAPSALKGTRPEMTQNWLTETTSDRVGFFCAQESSIYSFALASFLVDDVLPAPAV